MRPRRRDERAAGASGSSEAASGGAPCWEREVERRSSRDRTTRPRAHAPDRARLRRAAECTGRARSRTGPRAAARAARGSITWTPVKSQRPRRRRASTAIDGRTRRAFESRGRCSAADRGCGAGPASREPRVLRCARISRRRSKSNNTSPFTSSERLVAEEAAHAARSAARAQDPRLVRVAHAQAEARGRRPRRAAPSTAGDAVLIDRPRVTPWRAQRARASSAAAVGSSTGSAGLARSQRQRPHALAEPGGEDHGLHCEDHVALAAAGRRRAPTYESAT